MTEPPRSDEFLPFEKDEHYFRSVLNHLHEEVMIIDEDYQIVDVNDTFLRNLGYRREEVIGKFCHQITHNYDHPCQTEDHQCPLQAVFQNGQPTYTVHQHVNRQGEPHWVDLRFSPLKDKSGHTRFVIEAARNISDVIQAQKLAEERAVLLDSLFKTSASGMGLVEGRVFKYVNETFCRLTGYSMAELIGQSVRMVYISDDDFRFAASKIYEESLKTDGNTTYEITLRRKDGTLFEVLFTATIITPNTEEQLEEEPLISFAIFDISDRMRAEAQLKASRDELALVTDTIPNMLAYIDADERYRYVNDHYANWYHVSKTDIVGKKVQEVNPEKTYKFSKPLIDQVLRGEEAFFEGPILDLNGHPHTLYARYIPHFDQETSQVKAFLVIIEDITERRRVEGENRKLLQAMDQSPVSVIITDRRGNIEYVNPMFCQTSGYDFDEVIGQNPRILKSGEQSDEFYQSMWRTITQGLVWHGVLHNKRKDGTLYWEEASIGPIRNEDNEIINFIALKEHITHQKELEAQLQQAQKMDAIGQLAGGVAHDFNNLLTVIEGYTELAMYRVTEASPVHEHLQQIQATVERAVALTGQLLAFSRKQPSKPIAFNLNSQISAMQKMLRRLIREDVELITVLRPDVCNINADPGQIEQVIMNLCVNARDAMPNGGRLTLRTENVKVLHNTPSYLPPVPDMLPGHYVFLSVQDQGCGISETELEHIFEPFFTTKRKGEGTGLGLSTVYGIVKQSGGVIKVHSKLDEGTTFELYFPAVEPAEMISEEITDSPNVLGDRGGHGKEVILVVEDDESARALIVSVLQEFGYKVLAAGSGEIALNIAAAYPIDMLLTDVIMPQMGGRELAAKFSKLYPDCKLLLMSGYMELHDFTDIEAMYPFIKKPFSPVKLVAKVRQIFENP